MTVFDGIVMDVIAQGPELPFVPHRMFPEPPLPHATFCFPIQDADEWCWGRRRFDEVSDASPLPMHWHLCRPTMS